MSTKLPAVIDIPEVPIAITERIVTDAETVKALKERGLIPVNHTTISGLSNLGIALKGAGVLNHQRGRALVTQERIDEAMALVLERMRDKKTKAPQLIGFATAMAQLSKAVTESQHLSVDIEGLVVGSTGGPAEKPEPATTKTFAPGTKVTPQPGSTLVVANHAHFNTDPTSLKT